MKARSQIGKADRVDRPRTSPVQPHQTAGGSWARACQAGVVRSRAGEARQQRAGQTAPRRWGGFLPSRSQPVQSGATDRSGLAERLSTRSGRHHPRRSRRRGRVSRPGSNDRPTFPAGDAAFAGAACREARLVAQGFARSKASPVAARRRSRAARHWLPCRCAKQRRHRRDALVARRRPRRRPSRLAGAATGQPRAAFRPLPPAD